MPVKAGTPAYKDYRPMTYRLFIAAVFMLAIYGAVRWVKGRGMPTELAPLEMKVGDLPMTLGEWKGESIALDPDIFKGTGATMICDRSYRDRGGRTVSVHLAVFADIGDGHGLPHSPEICYPNNGWSLGEPKYLPLDQGDATKNLAEFVKAEQQGRAAYVLFWYQIDGRTYTTTDQQKSLILACRGRAFRPPSVKVMLQTDATTPDEAERTLKSFADLIYAWTRGFH